MKILSKPKGNAEEYGRWAVNPYNGCPEIQLHPVEECQPCPPGIGNKVKATECKCCKCGKQAVAFWPFIDPDIPSLPYCRKCLDHEKLKALINIYGAEEGRQMFNKLSNQNKADGR